MPTITAQSIISNVKTVLQDTTNVRWQDVELTAYLNDAQREICMLRPDANSQIAPVALVAGTKQSIPDNGTALIRVTRNMGANGTTPGRAIRHVPMDLLDANVPNWHSASAVAEIQHVAADPRFPATFYVYPPSNGTTQVEVVYAAPPNSVPNLQTTGTYSQTGNTVTLTITDHGLAVGSWMRLDFTTGAGVDGVFQVATVTATNTFTVTSSTSQSTSGSVTCNPVINVDDVFATPILDYVCFRAYMKDQDLGGNSERAAYHRKLFESVMQAKMAADAAVTATKVNVKG